MDHEGKQLGVLTLADALKAAEQVGLDLVEVAPQAVPPVCRIMDFGKYRYEQTKQEREAKKHQHAAKTKEIKYRPTIEEHDYQTKLKQMLGFLEKGCKIKVTLTYRGREMAHLDLGQKVLEKIVKDIEGHGAVESAPKLLGRFYIMVIAPVRSH